MEISIIESIRKKIEESNKLFEDYNKKYYLDVLDFLNLLFEDNSKNISNIKFRKITLNSNVFELYNKINQHYKLNKPEFDIETFNNLQIDDPNDNKSIFYDIALRLSNYLLEKLNYKLKIKYIDINTNKVRFILESLQF